MEESWGDSSQAETVRVGRLRPARMSTSLSLGGSQHGRTVVVRGRRRQDNAVLQGWELDASTDAGDNSSCAATPRASLGGSSGGLAAAAAPNNRRGRAVSRAAQLLPEREMLPAEMAVLSRNLSAGAAAAAQSRQPAFWGVGGRGSGYQSVAAVGVTGRRRPKYLVTMAAVPSRPATHTSVRRRRLNTAGQPVPRVGGGRGATSPPTLDGSLSGGIGIGRAQSSPVGEMMSDPGIDVGSIVQQSMARAAQRAAAEKRREALAVTRWRERQAAILQADAQEWEERKALLMGMSDNESLPSSASSYRVRRSPARAGSSTPARAGEEMVAGVLNFSGVEARNRFFGLFHENSRLVAAEAERSSVVRQKRSPRSADRQKHARPADKSAPRELRCAG